jgi:hypothetical protein
MLGLDDDQRILVELGILQGTDHEAELLIDEIEAVLQAGVQRGTVRVGITADQRRARLVIAEIHTRRRRERE